ncbi:MAG: transporter substrate-binding domain-containing protein [Betaproteobacteria bacterium]|nr:transporter substrate-binding domain-containing protein [Betaproteobacteria bacterium]MBI2290664.1 transporter substrate-binding domain-containing protein [Betaproteobacteria bacterium]MBI3057263.1 transporter substrate-binding domain-containing protein [Betaproteobacteria bacterium]
MRVHDWLIAGVVGLFISGCAGTQTAPSPETKAALAPTGKLRVAFITAVIYGMKDSATGELKGVAVDLGKELARRVGVPFDPVVYTGNPVLIGGAKSGEWDVALTGIVPERAAVMDFSAPYMELEHGYLVLAGVSIATVSDVDKPGVRVGVLERSGTDIHLSRTLKNATLVRTKSVAELFALAEVGKADVISIGKPGLFAIAAKQPGSRVLDGRILVEPIGMSVPKGRDAAAALYIGKFVEEAKADGLVRSAIERAGLRGVVVAPLK